MTHKIIIVEETTLEEAIDASLRSAELEKKQAERLSRLLSGVDIFGGSTVEKDPEADLLAVCAGAETLRAREAI